MIKIFNAVPNILVNRKRIILTLISWEFRELRAKVKQFGHCSARICSCRLLSCLELKYTKRFYRSLIINTGLLHDLISHDHYPK